MRVSTAWVTSSGETLRARYRRRSWVAGTKQRSDGVTGVPFREDRRVTGDRRGRPILVMVPPRRSRGRDTEATAASRARGTEATAASLRAEDLPRIQRVAQPVADEVDAEHGEEDRRAREDRPVGR